jgi:hypothetical protein
MLTQEQFALFGGRGGQVLTLYLDLDPARQADRIRRARERGPRAA